MFLHLRLQWNVMFSYFNYCLFLDNSWENWIYQKNLLEDMITAVNCSSKPLEGKDLMSKEFCIENVNWLLFWNCHCPVKSEFCWKECMYYAIQSNPHAFMRITQHITEHNRIHYIFVLSHRLARKSRIEEYDGRWIPMQ